MDGADGAAGGNVINAAAASDEFLASLEVMSEITSVEISSPPVVTFTLTNENGVPITGIVPFWENPANNFVRFTLAKLVPAVGPEADDWVAYTRDAMTNEPDYDRGASLVDHGDGSYTFTFNTDVTNVPGVLYEPGLTHRLAGQIGARRVPLAPQNLVHDFVPSGAPITTTRNIAIMETCNECHENLVFHGRRFKVEYCTNCHNPDLTGGEGNFSFMIHRIHAAGSFTNLDGGIDYSYVTYPQDLRNCRKCHDGLEAATPDADNWKMVPSVAACDGCHNNFSTGTHTGPPQANDSLCFMCHSPTQIEEYHTTPNATPNNPGLLTPSHDPAFLINQRNITYELLSATVGGMNEVTIQFRILSDGTPLDIANLPQDLLDGNRYPGFLLAWALPQDGIATPMDYNNLGRRGAQPLSFGLDAFAPIETMAPIGTLSYDMGTGVNTAIITDPGSQFPMAATLRAVGLQGYLRQDITGDGNQDVSLHTPSAVVAVTGDDVRRTVVDNDKCASCHEWFEGHGGNRTYNIAICTLCHNPNQSSSGRTVTDPSGRNLDDALMAALMDGSLTGVVVNDPTTYPEDAQNLKDLVHGIHSAAFRTRPFQHVRGGRQGYYDWSHITFPRGASTQNCSLCHLDGTYMLPLGSNLLATTVRTTDQADGQDATVPLAEAAFQGVPNSTDWITTAGSSSCAGCHTSDDALAHMLQNGGLASSPLGGIVSNRSLFGTTFESCSVCHGSGSFVDIEVVHAR